MIIRPQDLTASEQNMLETFYRLNTQFTQSPGCTWPAGAHSVLRYAIHRSGLGNAVTVAGRATVPNYKELGMRKAGTPTDDDIAAYQSLGVAAGADVPEGSFVCDVILTDSDLMPDRFGIWSFRALAGLTSKYLGRANDTNHSFDQNDASGRLIDLWLGHDPGTALDQRAPVEALRRQDPINGYAGQYVALCGRMLFPAAPGNRDAIDALRTGLVQDVSIAWARGEASVCSVCDKEMGSYWFWEYCEEHGFPGGTTDEGEAVVAIYKEPSDVRVFGHVTDGACRRARYVIDPEADR